MKPEKLDPPAVRQQKRQQRIDYWQPRAAELSPRAKVRTLIEQALRETGMIEDKDERTAAIICSERLHLQELAFMSRRRIQTFIGLLPRRASRALLDWILTLVETYRQAHKNALEHLRLWPAFHPGTVLCPKSAELLGFERGKFVDLAHAYTPVLAFTEGRMVWTRELAGPGAQRKVRIDLATARPDEQCGSQLQLWSSVFIYLAGEALLHPWVCYHTARLGYPLEHFSSGPVFPIHITTRFVIKTVQDLEEIVLRAFLGYYEKR